MKLHNSNIREILEQSAKRSTPLTQAEIDIQYQLFLKKIKPHATPVESSLPHFYKQLISHITMVTPKQIAAMALILIIGAGSLTIGYDRALAYNLAQEIKNAPNASEYSHFDMDFTDVILYGKVVNKEYVSRVLEKHSDAISIVGGIMDIKLPDSTTVEDMDWSYTEEHMDEGFEPTAEDFRAAEESQKEFAQKLGISLEEVEQMMDAESNEYPYGIGFEEAVRFLELTKDKEATYIGIDKDGKIIFFSTVTF